MSKTNVNKTKRKQILLQIGRILIKNSSGAHICLYTGAEEAGGAREAGTFITPKSKVPGRNALSEKLYIYMYTHIHIYIHINKSLHMSIWLLKNTNCFTTIAPLTLL